MPTKHEVSTLVSISIEDPFWTSFSTASLSLPTSVWESDEGEDVNVWLGPRGASPASASKPVSTTKGRKLKKQDRLTINDHLGELKNQWDEKDKKDEKGLVSEDALVRDIEGN